LNIANQNLVLAPFLAVAICSPALAASGSRLQGFPAGGMINGSFVATQMSTLPVATEIVNVFDAIRGHSIVFTIEFDAIDHEDYAPEEDGGRRRILTTSPAHVNFYGDSSGYLQQVLAPTLNVPVQIEIREDAAGSTVWVGFNICQARTPEYFRFKGQLSLGGREPSVQAVGLERDTMALQRFDTANTMTDLATGPARYTLGENRSVAVEPRTFGEVKALYRSQP